jgi:hypothetical protein
MGASHRHRKAFFERHPTCCFCTGNAPAATIDHVPSRACFAGRIGPEGFEFPACEACNSASRISEIVFAFYSRTISQEGGHRDDVADLYRGVKNNAPDCLPQLNVTANEKRKALVASDALEGNLAAARRAAEEYEADVERDPKAWIGEMEDGYILWDQSQVHEMKVETAEEAVQDVRKAFAISAYHHWERYARRWTGSGSSTKHDKLVERTVALSYPVAIELERVHRLANVLKHDNDLRGAELIQA